MECIFSLSSFWLFSSNWQGFHDHIRDVSLDLITAWKVSKYGVVSSPYFPVFGLNYEDLLRKPPYSIRIQENMDQKWLRIWTLFANLPMQSEYREIRTRNNSVFGHFSHSADVYFHHQNCHVRSHSSSWFSVACATPLVIFLTSCLLHLVRQSFCWNCFRDSDFGIATLWFIGFYISFIYFVTPIHCSYQLGLYF